MSGEDVRSTSEGPVLDNGVGGSSSMITVRESFDES